MIHSRGMLLVAAALVGLALAAPATASDWQSRAIKGSQGPMATVDGKELQLRYEEEPYIRNAKDNWAKFRTFLYADTRPELAVKTAVMPAGITGDPVKGKQLFIGSKGPCTGCHVIRDDHWPMGNIGPDLAHFGETGHSDQETFQMIYDMRAVNPDSFMPPWGASGRFTDEEIVHMVAFLQTQKGPEVVRKDPNIDPHTRYVSEGFGDNLDPTNNPAILMAEAASAKVWAAPGPNGKTCESCHAGGPEKMAGVATEWPRYLKEYGRIMSIEDFLGPHGEKTMGANVLPAQSDDNILITIAIKMASNGMPLQLDLNSPEAKAALKRGEETFNRRVGQRNHACIDCHTEERGGGKFLGGRLLGTIDQPLTNHFPTYRTNFTRPWDIRKRFQWCMLPLGMNFIPGDSIEFAELELFLTSFGQGKPLNVPGLSH